MNTQRLDFRKGILHTTLDSLEKFDKAGCDIMPTVVEFMLKLHAHADTTDITLSKIGFDNTNLREELKTKRENTEHIIGMFADVFGEKVVEIQNQLKK